MKSEINKYAISVEGPMALRQTSRRVEIASRKTYCIRWADNQKNMAYFDWVHKAVD